MNRFSAVLFAAVLLAAPSSSRSQEVPFELEGFIITASPMPRALGDVARSVTVLDGEELRAGGVTLLSDALAGVPGVAVVRGGSFGAATSVFMRGGESDYVQVLVDGVQVNQPGGSFDFAGLTLENVERIEVVRGPASALYGSDAMAGVIQIVTRTGRGAPSGELSVRGGSYGRREGSVRIEGGGSASRWSLAVGSLHTDGVLSRNNSFDNTVLSANVRLVPDGATRAGVALRLADRTYHFPTDGSGAVTDENAFTHGDEASIAVTASRRVSRGVELRGGVTLAQTDGGTEDEADSPADSLGYWGFTSLDHVRRATADVRADLRLGAFTGSLGAEIERQEQRSFSESLSQWGNTTGRSENARDNRAGYVHVTGRSGATSFAAGARMEDNERFGRFTSWSAEAAWRALPDTRLRAAAGRGVKEPTFYENFATGWVVGDPDLAPERTRSLEVGLEQTLADGRVRLRATAFEQRFRDLIQYVARPVSPSAPNFANVAGAEARGVELDGEARLGPVHASADWTWLRTEVVDATDEEEGAEFLEGSRLLRRPTHTVAFHASLLSRRGTLRADLRVVGEREDRDYSAWPTRRVALPRHAVLDIGVEMPVGDVTLALRAENLLDERYEEVFGFPAPGRGVYVGGKVTFGGS